MRKDSKGDTLLPVGFAVTVEQPSDFQNGKRDYTVSALSIAIDSRDGSRYTPQNDINAILWKDMIRFGMITQAEFDVTVALFAKMYDATDRLEAMLTLERLAIAERANIVAEESREEVDQAKVAEHTALAEKYERELQEINNA